MGRQPINGRPLTRVEIETRYRKRKRDRIATLETAIRAMLATPRLPGAAREIGRVALEGKANDANK